MKTYKVVMIDDNPVDCLLMGEALNRYSDLVEFITIIDSNSYGTFIAESLDSIDLLILDMNMPGKSGLEVLTQVRKTKTMRRLPIIIFSGSNIKEEVLMAYEKGANAYIHKPLEHNEFESVANGIVQFWAKLPVLN